MRPSLTISIYSVLELNLSGERSIEVKMDLPANKVLLLSRGDILISNISFFAQFLSRRAYRILVA